MTTRTLMSIRQLNEEGANDSEIAEILDLSPGVVSYWRKYLGLKAVRRYRTKKRYVVKNVWTEETVCSGSSRECAQALGINVESFRSKMSRWRQSGKGMYQIELEE